MDKYDSFISYRRDGGRDIARPIKLELEKHGYSVFLDFDGLKDGSFNQTIKDAIAIKYSVRKILKYNFCNIFRNF